MQVGLGNELPRLVCVANVARAEDDRVPLVVHRGAHNFVILNRFPYTSGHIMVVPYGHISTLEALPDEALVELIRLARESEKHLRAIYRPEGLNLGLNIGKSAGAVLEIESALLQVGPVALETAIGQNGADVAIEANFLGGGWYPSRALRGGKTRGQQGRNANQGGDE